LAVIAQVEAPPSAPGKPILTLPQARDVVFSVLKEDRDSVAKPLKHVLYLIRKAVSAHKSHRKTQIRNLKKCVKELDELAA